MFVERKVKECPKCGKISERIVTYGKGKIVWSCPACEYNSVTKVTLTEKDIQDKELQELAGRVVDESLAVARERRMYIEEKKRTIQDFVLNHINEYSLLTDILEELGNMNSLSIGWQFNTEGKLDLLAGLVREKLKEMLREYTYVVQNM